MIRGDLVSCFRIEHDRCRVVDAGSVCVRALRARWIDDRRDSVELRRQILVDVSTRCSILDPLPLTAITLECVVARAFAGEPSVSLEKPLPRARARVVISKRVTSEEELSECIEYEAQLSEAFAESEIGFVDGNEIGQGEFSIFLFGPRRVPLLHAVTLHIPAGSGWRILDRRSR